MAESFVYQVRRIRNGRLRYHETRTQTKWGTARMVKGVVRDFQSTNANRAMYNEDYGKDVPMDTIEILAFDIGTGRDVTKEFTGG